jgi:hypothetical protein
MKRKKLVSFGRHGHFFDNVPCSQFDNPDRYAVTTLLLSRGGDQHHQQLVFVQGDSRSRCRGLPRSPMTPLPGGRFEGRRSQKRPQKCIHDLAYICSERDLINGYKM